ncbi:MAG: hypothetical protein KDC04_07375 [Saprospiraceae bacterium]|nr:hypothetical protein [Saprospiraceae bacterium]
MAIIFQWELNQESIIQTECVNKSKPAMMCKGKCALVKKFDNIAQNEPSTTPNKILAFNLEVYLVSQNSDLVLLKIEKKNILNKNFDYKRWQSLLLASSIFDPPDHKAYLIG